MFSIIKKVAAKHWDYYEDVYEFFMVMYVVLFLVSTLSICLATSEKKANDTLCVNFKKNHNNIEYFFPARRVACWLTQPSYEEGRMEEAK